MAYLDDLEPLDQEQDPPIDFGDYNPIQGPRKDPEQFLSGAQYAEPQRMAQPPMPPEPWSEGDNMYQQKLLNASSQLRQLRSSGTLSEPEVAQLQRNIDRDLVPLQVRQGVLLEQQRIKAEKQVMQQHALANTINSQGLAADAQSFEQRVPLVRFPGGREVPFYYDGSKWLPMPADESAQANMEAQREQRTAQLEHEAAQREDAVAQQQAEREQQRELEQRQMEWERHQMAMEAEGGPGTSLPRPEAAQGQTERQRVETLAVQMGIDDPRAVDQAMEQMDLMREWARHPTPSGVPVRLTPLARALWEEHVRPPEREQIVPGVTLQGRTAEQWRAEDAARPRGVDVWGGQAMSQFPNLPPSGGPNPGLEPSGRPEAVNTRVSAITGRPYEQTIYAQGEGPASNQGPPPLSLQDQRMTQHLREQAQQQVKTWQDAQDRWRTNYNRALTRELSTISGTPTPEQRRAAEERARDTAGPQRDFPFGGNVEVGPQRPLTPERIDSLIEQRVASQLPPRQTITLPRGANASLINQYRQLGYAVILGGGTGTRTPPPASRVAPGAVPSAQGSVPTGLPEPAPAMEGVGAAIQGAVGGSQESLPTRDSAPQTQQPDPLQQMAVAQQNLQRLRQAGTIGQDESARTGQSIARVQELLRQPSLTPAESAELGRLHREAIQPLVAGPDRMTQAIRGATTQQLQQRLRYGTQADIPDAERAAIHAELRRRGVR